MLRTVVKKIARWLGEVVREARDEYGPSQVAAETEQAVVEPLREAGRRSRAPGWLAALRTQIFTGLAATGLFLFGGLTALVSDGLTAGVDLAVTQAIQGVSAIGFGPLMIAVSAFGFLPQSLLLVAGVATILWLADYRTEAGFAVVASGSALLTEGIKSIVARPRPDADLVTVLAGATGHSFPSGHTLFYVTFFGFLAYVAYALWKPGRLRTAVLWLCGALILLVGPSRIWMGQHWASDVLASYALGLTYLVILVWAYSRYRLPQPSVSTALA
jgi:undecaprenyl-diphosphatase